MSSIEDFNRIEDCNKINPDCIDAYFDLDWDGDTTLCWRTPWGDQCHDFDQLIKNGETCTRLYLTPEDGDPNCLAYDAECGETYCITGDDLSGIISMHLLKDTDRQTPNDGDIYMWSDEKQMFERFDLGSFVKSMNTAIANLNQTINDLKARLTPPEGAPDGVRVVFGNINDYSDPNIQVNEGSGSITSYNKNHGLYSHSLNESRFGDEVFG